MIPNPDPKLTFGAINLIGTDAELAANGFRYECLADGTEWGNPVAIEQKVISWLQDGALLSLTGHDNREAMVVRIRIVGEDSNKLALAEQALMLETGKSNTLTWTPPDGGGAPCVFDVVMSNLEHSFDDLGEIRSLRERVYTLRIQALPFARSETLVTVDSPAPAGTQTVTVIDNGSSATGWTYTHTPPSGSPVTGAASQNAGYVFTQASNISVTAATLVALARSGMSANLAGTPYISVDISPYPYLVGTAYVGGLSFKLNGLPTTPSVQEGDTYWFDASALGITTLTDFSITASVKGTVPANETYLSVNTLSRSNFLGTQATNRQLSRVVPVAGSARTQVSLALEDASVALGTALVYTCPVVPGIIQPNIMAWIDPAFTPTPDATTVSGFTQNINATAYFNLPADSLLPGGHLLIARVKNAATVTEGITWTAYPRMGTTNLPGEQTGAEFVDFTAGVWQTVTLGTVNLPPRGLGADGIVQLWLSGNDVVLDEAWLFNIESGRLTWVECGTASPSAGGTSNRLWLDSPSLTNPAPAVYRGFAADRSDSYHVASELLSFGNHEFTPPTMNVFTVTTNSQAADLSLAHYPRYHTHVVE